MRKLGEQWVEEIDGKKHMLKAVNYSEGCNGCIFLRYDPDEFYTCNRGRLGCSVDDGMIIKDLGILNEDGLLPCPFCGEYPTTDVEGVAYCNTCGCDIDLDKWNRRA